MSVRSSQMFLVNVERGYITESFNLHFMSNIHVLLMCLSCLRTGKSVLLPWHFHKRFPVEMRMARRQISVSQAHTNYELNLPRISNIIELRIPSLYACILCIHIWPYVYNVSLLCIPISFCRALYFSVNFTREL